jgi:acyl transferase domain-containing protein
MAIDQEPTASTRSQFLKATPILGSMLLLPAAAQATPKPKGPPDELRRWLSDQLEVQQANERRTVRLRNRQEAFVRSTHDVIQDQIATLKREVSGAGEKAAVDEAAEALHAHAKDLHVKTQKTMTKQPQMIRRQINQTQRMLDEL